MIDCEPLLLLTMVEPTKLPLPRSANRSVFPEIRSLDPMIESTEERANISFGSLLTIPPVGRVMEIEASVMLPKILSSWKVK